MKKLIQIPVFLIILTGVFSCGESKKEEAVTEEPEEREAPPKENLAQFQQDFQVTTYPDAILEMYSPLENDSFPEGKIPFEFNIKNYPFAEGLKGFQLQLIINGNDPVGYNMPIFQKEFDEGTYKVVAFLVDDEGFALKEYGNFVSRDFTVGASRPFPETQEPFLAVNMPENGQEYNPGEAVLVDFMWLDGNLVDQGLAVEVSVDGNQFQTQEMKPIKITGLPVGNYEIKVALAKIGGEELSGPFAINRKKIIIQ